MDSDSSQGLPKNNKAKAGELLPSVLRTSADLAHALKVSTKAAATPGQVSSLGDAQPGKRGPARVAACEVLGTSTLPRVDAAHHQAMPARAPRTAMPQQHKHTSDATAEPRRPNHTAATASSGRSEAPKLQQQACSSTSSSKNGPPVAEAVTAAALSAATGAAVPGPLAALGTCAASALVCSPAAVQHPSLAQQDSSSNAGWIAAHVPAVGSVAMTSLPAAAAWLSGPSDSKAADHAASGGSQEPAVPRAAAADRAASPAGTELRLQRPFNPRHPNLYWKPQQGNDVASSGAAACVIDKTLGAQLLLDAGAAQDTTAPVSHTRQRKSILLRLPVGAGPYLSAVPAVIQDRAGHACLLVLPSDKPSSRKEAVAVEELLAVLLQDPSTSVQKAVQWRVATLSALCAESLGVVAEAVQQRDPVPCWQFRQLTRNLTGKVLGSCMAEAASSMLNSADINPTAAQLVHLINNKDAGEQVAAAAAAATLEAAAATACVAVRSFYPAGRVADAHEATASDGCATTGTFYKQASHRHNQSHDQQQQQNWQGDACQLSPTKLQAQVDLRGSIPTPADLQTGRPQDSTRDGVGCTALPSGSRRSTEVQGPYAALTLVTSSLDTSSHGHQALGSTRVSTAFVNPLSPGLCVTGSMPCCHGQQQQQHPLPLQQLHLVDPRSGSSSRAGSPAPVLAPHTPKGHSAVQPALPALCGAATDTTSHAAVGSNASSSPPAALNAQHSTLSPRARTSASRSTSPVMHPESRLSMAAGRSSPGSQSPTRQGPAGPEMHSKQVPDVIPEAPTVTNQEAGGNSNSQISGSGQQDKGGQLSSLYGLSLAAAICMSDVVRQVEVACAERGRALAYAWNCSMSAAEATMHELRAQNHNLLHINGELAAGQVEMMKEFKAVDFLRREALRFRRGMEDVEERLGVATENNTRLQTQLAQACHELEAVEAFVNRRLSCLRWQNAFSVLSTYNQQSIIKSGGCKGDRGRVLPKVKMLEKLANVVRAAEHRKKLRKCPAQAQLQVSDVSQLLSTGLNPPAPGQVHLGLNGGDRAHMLSVLTPEARTMVLAGMPAAQRWRIMEAMRDEERAEVLVVMGLGLRKEAVEALDPRVWQRTMEAVRNSGTFAARYISSLDTDDAAKEFMTWGTFQQVDCLASLDTYTAAAILSRVPDALRRDLLGMLEPYVAANIVQAMLPPPAAAAIESLDLNKAMAILIAMDPDKAASVLTDGSRNPAAFISTLDIFDTRRAGAHAHLLLPEMGASQAATKLIPLDADTRNSIIESMAPRVAANTLVSMEDVMQAAHRAGEPGSPQLLTLSGCPESPVMGAMSDLNPQNAYTIMNYMSIKDKAALLASMQPEAVARLLACMDPNEAVLLLSALGDGTSKLVSNCLSSDERDALVQVLKAADCKHSPSCVRRAGIKGSFREAAEPLTVGRLMGAYEAIEAVTLDGGSEDSAAADATGSGKGRQSASKLAGSRNDRHGHKDGSKGKGNQLQQRKRHVQAGADSHVQDFEFVSPRAAQPAPLGAPGAAMSTTAGPSTRPGELRSTGSKSGSDDSQGELLDTTESEHAPHHMAKSTASIHGSKVASRTQAAPLRANKQPADGATAASNPAVSKRSGGTSTSASTAAGQDIQQPPSSSGEDWGDTDTADASDSQHATTSSASQVATHGAARGNKTRCVRASDGDLLGISQGSVAAAGGRRGSAGSAAAAAGPAAGGVVPPLLFERRQSSSDEAGEDTPGSTTHRSHRADAEHTSLISDAEGSASGHSTPRTTPPLYRGPSRSAAAVAKSTVAGRKALKEALKSQAATKRGSTHAAASGVSVGLGYGGASREGAVADDESDVQAGHAGGPGAAGGLSSQMDPPPQVKLGKVPKNARLIEAMAQHKNAKPKPKGWLMAVLDSIYKEGETLLRKLGRADMVKKQSVPEIVFAYFHNKYGQRALVNENVGSLVNTLTLYQHSDLRLEAFARLLSEEWDVSIFLDFLVAQNMCLQPAKVACIEYPREAGKDDQYPWVCLWKAVWVANTVLGVRSQAARDRFNEFLHMACLPADDADVERLRRERREAAAKDGVKGGDTEIPDKFFKLARIRFLLLLCKELLPINKYIVAYGEDRFTAMDMQRTGKLDVVAVRGFVKNMSLGCSDAQVSEYISNFVSNSEGATRDIPPEQVAVLSVTELSREAFVAGVSSTQSVRDHIKLHLLPPARLEEENEESQVFFSLLAVLMARHSKALLPVWGEALSSADQRGSNLLQQQLATVTASRTASDARFKAYVGLLLGLINVSVQGYVDSLLSIEAQVDTLHSDELEDGLLRLEDVALILVRGCSYLVSEDSEDLAAARTVRLPLCRQVPSLGKQLLMHRLLRARMMVNAAAVLQRVWRKRQRHLRAKQLAQAADA